LSDLEFSANLVNLIASFVKDRNFKVLAKGEFSTPRKIAAGFSQNPALPK
jgi:hypothetical protein